MVKYALAANLLLASPFDAHGLTINTNFVSPGNEIRNVGTAIGPAQNVAGGGDLPTIVRAAADAWEALILDDYTLTLEFGWFPTQPISSTAFHQGVTAGGVPAREILGSLAFNGDDGVSFTIFMDPTPGLDEEFNFSRQDFEDFGGGRLEKRRELVGMTPETSGNLDLYSTALHEIGHALGLVGWSFFEFEAVDGDIDVAIGPYAGTELPLSASHLAVVGPIMSNTGRPLGTRRGVTQVDLLAVCQLSQFTQCNLELPGVDGDFDDNGVVDGLDLLAWQRGDSPRPLAAADLAAWQENYGALATSAAQSITVPEPGAGTLLAIAWLLARASPRRCRVLVGASTRNSRNSR